MSLFIYYLLSWASDLNKHKEINTIQPYFILQPIYTNSPEKRIIISTNLQLASIFIAISHQAFHMQYWS